MFNRTGENLHYQSLFLEVGRSVLVLARHKCVSSSAAAMCCPGESARTFIKSCCLEKWILVHVWDFGLFFPLWLCFKANHSFLCNLTSVFPAYLSVISVWLRSGLVFAAWLSPRAWPTVPACTRSEVPAPGGPATCRSSLVHSRRLLEIWQQ